MDEFKYRASLKLEALQDAAVTVAYNSRSKLDGAIQKSIDAIHKIHEIILEIWSHEMVLEGRERAAVWGREAVRRIREGALPLSPMVLHRELMAILKDRVWRQSLVVFMCGAALGGGAGLLLGLRAARLPPASPTCRALLTQQDHSVMLVEDAVCRGAARGEVLVRVQAFSVCGADRGALRGRGAALRSLLSRAPLAVGRGFAGVVLDVGPGVTDLELGDQVWGCVSEWRGGACAEQLAVRSTHISKRPARLSAPAAACLSWAGTRALAALSAVRLLAGSRVLVCGAASGEGCAVLQLVVARGARATAAARPAARDLLADLGGAEFVELSDPDSHVAASWLPLEQEASRTGPWDAVLVCPGAPAGPPPRHTLLKARAPHGGVVELRPRALLTDRLPAPLFLTFAAGFYVLKALRWICGCGTHTDWLESPESLRAGLEALRQLVQEEQLVPVLDKVFLPQEFEEALAHACSDQAVGTTVIRFP
ncbi:reticulon-4-interacting protein 1 homolog, mitochondrial-like [Leptidea sinapis]|uniref:reticulon-4-interacting protein 1 homolog, mitochondrial-like n=1 Tax=Leptidea sinapis TaxID=189913 RepID=UPI00213D6C76|nr:reticulon-4-interacting protein 1 homolog, mitochondrial-like [Leptidea sinapis]